MLLTYNKMVHKNKIFFYGKIIIFGLCIEKSNLLLCNFDHFHYVICGVVGKTLV